MQIKNTYRQNSIILFFVVLLSFSFVCCKQPKSKIYKQKEESTYREVKDTRVKFNFNQSFEIKEIKIGSSLSDIHVSGIGFQNCTKTLKFMSVDPFEKLLIADIDKNGFEELYILTRSVGSGSYSQIIGITSNKGTSYKSIYIPEYDNTLDIKFDYLDGYMGHDSIYVQNKMLCREFPVYKLSDSNSKPTGGIRKIIYKLVEVDNSFSLQINSHQMVEL